jgi:Zn-dependent metalloprotease
MTYGDGSGTYFDVLTSIDVAAHEIGHVCEKQQT